MYIKIKSIVDITDVILKNDILHAAQGLVVTAQLKPIAQHYGVAELPALGGSTSVLLVAMQVREAAR
jgi:hypothetical protein